MLLIVSENMQIVIVRLLDYFPLFLVTEKVSIINAWPLYLFGYLCICLMFEKARKMRTKCSEKGTKINILPDKWFSYL